jgi:HK97 family phage prohead protease
MYRLNMELRDVNPDGRTLEGVVVPYDETSYLTPNPAGERVLRGAFAKSAKQRGGRVFLFRGHDHAHPVGRAVSFTDEPDGLHGTFTVRSSVLGDETLSDVREGYLPGMSVGFRPLQTRQGAAGETEVVEAQLMEVSLVAIGAYDGARVLALRHADYAYPPAVVLGNPPPVMPGWSY